MAARCWQRHAEWNPEDLWAPGCAPGFCAEYAQDSGFITPFLLPGEGNPAILIFPGGGYAMKAEHEGLDIAQRFNALGFSCFVLDYRVKPYGFPAAQLDARRAVRYVRANAQRFGICKNKLAVLGFSAGGHLAACTGILFDDGDAQSADPVERESSRPDAMVLCYAVTNIAKYYPIGIQRDAHLPCTLSEYEAILNPIARVNAQSAPAFLWHTTEDATVNVNASVDMYSALHNCGVPAELHLFPGGPHGIGLAPGHAAQSWSELCAAFLKNQWQIN